MRFDLDEARVSGGAQLKRHESNSSGGPSVSGTLSRNLGDEIVRRLETQTKTNAVADADEVVETVVTTTTRVSSCSALPLNCQRHGSRSTPQPTSIPVILVDEDLEPSGDTVPALAQVSQDSPRPPAYSPHPEPINAQEVLDAAHPSDRSSRASPSLGEEYDALVEMCGMRCHVLEEQLRMRYAERIKAGVARPPFRRPSIPIDKSNIVNYIFYNVGDTLHSHLGTLAVWTVAVFASESLSSSFGTDQKSAS